MAKHEEYVRRTETLLQPIAEANNVEIYDIEFVKEASDWYLRAYIDKAEGVNINDCEAVSRALSDALDQADYIDEPYILEVSSPGLGRTLKKDKHLEKSLGAQVDLKTYQTIDGQKEHAGVLKSFDKETVVIVSDGEDKTFSRADIAVIKLAFDF